MMSPNSFISNHLLWLQLISKHKVVSSIAPEILRIVNAKTGVEVDGTGELWISSPSIAKGYYKQLDLSEATFKATLSLMPGVHFLRTGDLPFIQSGYLYICRRIKDLIIVNGVKVYPQDVECVVQEASSSVHPGCMAAVSPDCRILGLTTLNSLLQYINWLVWEVCSATECYRTRKLGYNNLNWPRCSARVPESLALTDGGFCQKQTLYISDYVKLVSL